MTPHPVKTATIRHSDGREVSLVLMRTGETKYHWQTPNGRPWESGVGFENEGAAIKSIRVSVESDPDLVGADLTVKALDPPPELRAAKRITDMLLPGKKGREKRIKDLSEIIRDETGIDSLVEAVSEMTAFWMARRNTYAMAVCPPIPGAIPRDLKADGLLRAVIVAMQKTTGQNFKNLIAILDEAPSMIVGAGKMPKGGLVQ